MQKKSLRWKFLMMGMVPFVLVGCQLVPVEEELPMAPIIQEYEAEEYVQITVLRGDLVLEESVLCRYMPAKQEDLAFGVSGEYIENIYVTEGQQVQAGELLAELYKGDLPEQISQLEYQLQVLALQKEHLIENKALELERQDVWLEHMGGKEKEDALEERADIEQDFNEQIQAVEDSLYIEALRLTELKEELSKRQIYAGIDGIVTYVRWTENGQRSDMEQKMFTVADMSTAAFTVTGEQAVHFPAGTEVVVHSPNGRDTYMTVSVAGNSLGASMMQTTEETEQVAYLQLHQPDPTLEEGDSAYVEVELDSRKDVLYLDKAAVKSADGREFVYVLNEEGWKVMQDVTTGLVTEKYVEIVSGLKEGDSVILE